MSQLVPARLVTLGQFGISWAIAGVTSCTFATVAPCSGWPPGSMRCRSVPGASRSFRGSSSHLQTSIANSDLASEFDHSVRWNAEEFRCRQRVTIRGLGQPAGKSHPSVMREPLR
jgi:hypothetical protein